VVLVIKYQSELRSAGSKKTAVTTKQNQCQHRKFQLLPLEGDEKLEFQYKGASYMGSGCNEEEKLTLNEFHNLISVFCKGEFCA